MDARRPLKKTLFTLAITVLAVIGGVMLIGVSGVLFLHSKTGQKFILGHGREFFADKFHIDVQFAEGSIDIFSGLHFRDLRILIRRENLKADIAIAKLDLHYNIGLLSRHLEIDEFKISHPFLKITLQDDTKPELPPAQSANPVESLRSYLESPLASVRLPRFSLESLDADIQTQTRNRGDQSEVRIRGLSLKMGVEISKNFFTFNGEIAGEEPITLKSKSLRSLVLVDGTWDLALKKEQGAWVYELKPSRVHLALKDVHVLQTQPFATTTLRLDNADFRSDIRLLAKSERLLSFDRASVQTLDFETKATAGKMLAVQAPVHGIAQETTIERQDLIIKSKQSAAIQSEFQFNAKNVFTKASLIKPVDFTWSGQATVTTDLASVEIKSTASLDQIPFAVLDLQTVHKEKPEPVRDFQGTFTLFFDPKLSSRLVSLASLKKASGFEIKTVLSGHRAEAQDKDGKDTGALDLKSKTTIPKLQMVSRQAPTAIDLTLDTHWRPETNRLNLVGDVDLKSETQGYWRFKWTQDLDHVVADKSGAKMALQGHGRTEVIELLAPDDEHKFPLKLMQPLVATHDFSFSEGQLVRANVTVELPLIELLDFGLIPNTTASLTAKSSDLTKAKDLVIDFEMKQGPGPSLEVGLQARGNTQTQELQAHGDLSIKIADDFPYVSKQTAETARQKLRGKIAFPWTLAVVRGEEVDLKGILSLNDVAWSSESVSLKGVTGLIPISEKLKLSLKPGGHKLAFKELIRQNAFERVDFERQRPLLENSNPLRISEIHWEDKTYGPFIGFFEVHQNMILAHQFDFDVGSGRVYGELSFDADPANLQMSLLSRLTNLNLNEILPSRLLSPGSHVDQNLSARAGLILNLNTGTMNGRVDVTQIGGPQLITLVNLMDPRYANEKMNSLRKILELGYPTSAEAAFSDGYMDLDVDLSILGVPKSQSVRGIPISSLISSKTAGLVQTIGEGYFP